MIVLIVWYSGTLRGFHVVHIVTYYLMTSRNASTKKVPKAAKSRKNRATSLHRVPGTHWAVEPSQLRVAYPQQVQGLVGHLPPSYFVVAASCADLETRLSASKYPGADAGTPSYALALVLATASSNNRATSRTKLQRKKIAAHSIIEPGGLHDEFPFRSRRDFQCSFKCLKRQVSELLVEHHESRVSRQV